MKMKDNITINDIFLFGILLFLFIMIVVRLNNDTKFNPATDVCDEDFSYGYPASLGENNPPQDNCYDCHNSNERYGDGMMRIRCTCCSSWHPKNKCELDATTDGCVCDEYTDSGQVLFKGRSYYEYKTLKEIYDKQGDCLDIRYSYLYNGELINTRDERYVNILQDMNATLYSVMCEKDKYDTIKVCIKSHLPPTPIKIDLSKEKCVEWTNESIECGNRYNLIRLSKGIEDYYISNKTQITYDQYCCIKKEPKTECEMGDGDYVLEENATKIVYFDNGMSLEYDSTKWHFVSMNNAKIIREEGKSVCRKKTIHDFTCDELWGCYEDYNNCPVKRVTIFGRQHYPESSGLKEYIDRCGGNKIQDTTPPTGRLI